MDTPRSSQATELSQAVNRIREAVARPSDEDLWGQLREQPLNETALAELYRRWSSPLRYRCLANGLSPHSADEVLNWAFAKALRRWPRITAPRRAFAYLWRTVDRDAWKRLAQERRRAEREQPGGAAVENATDPRNTSNPVVAQELSAAVDTALLGLSPSERLAVVLRHFLDLSLAEIAELMGCAPSSVNEYLGRAKDKLSRSLSAWKDTAPVVGAAGGLGLSATIAGAATSPDRVPAAVSAIVAHLKALATAGWSFGKVAATAGAVLLTGGLAVGGWGLTRTTQTEPAPAPTTGQGLPVPAPPEGLRTKYLRIAQSDLVPKLCDCLREILLGEGTIFAESVDQYDSRLDVTLVLQHKVEHKPEWRSRVRFIHDLESRKTTVYLDYLGTGKFTPPIDRTKPVVLWKNGPTLRFAPLERATALFESLPADERAATEATAYRTHLRRAFAPYLGVWYHRGDPKKVCSIEFVAGPRMIDEEEFAHENYGQYRLAPDGAPRALVYHESDVLFAPDRLEFPATGDWWVREPVR